MFFLVLLGHLIIYLPSILEAVRYGLWGVSFLFFLAVFRLFCVLFMFVLCVEKACWHMAGGCLFASGLFISASFRFFFVLVLCLDFLGGFPSLF